MENRTERRRLITIIGITIVILLLLLGSCGILRGLNLFKQENSMSVTDGQNAAPSLTYSASTQSTGFENAKDGEGEITYTLVRATNEKGIYVDYFSLSDKFSTKITVAPDTPAGVYELLIRAEASGDDGHNSLVKEFVVYATINKADGSYDELPTPIEGLLYNGSDQVLINPGSSSTGTIYYKLDDGEYSEKLPVAKEAGTYTVYYKLVGDANHNDVEEQSFTVTIGNGNVGAKPVSQVVTYDGNRHSIAYKTPEHVSKSGDASGVNAGVYSATYTLEKGYSWSDGTNGSITVSLTINRAPVGDKPHDQSVTYDGKPHYLDYSKPDGVSVSGIASGTDVGSYSAIYTPKDNYCWSDGTYDSIKATLTINKAKVDRPVNTEVTFVYNGKDQNNGYDLPEGIVLFGEDHGVNAGEYIANYTPDDNHCWSDGKSDTVTVKMIIVKAELEVPHIVGKKTFVYDGQRHEVRVSRYDHSLISLSGDTGKKRNAGEYEILVNLKDTINYQWKDGTTEAKVLNWSIIRKSLRVPSVAKTFTYKPNYQQSVKERDFDRYFNNRLMYIVESQKGIDAGDYTVTIGLIYPNNYQWSDGTVDDKEITWTIQKAKATFDLENPQELETMYRPLEQQLFFNGPENAIGEVTYSLKQARKQGTIFDTSDIYIEDESSNCLTLKADTATGVYSVIVTVKASGDKNYAAYEEDLYIRLTINKLDYTVKFNGNGADRGYVNDQKFTASLIPQRLYYNQYVKDGYDFIGWNTQIDGSGKSFEDTQLVDYLSLAPYEEDGVIELYAQWDAKTLKVFYELDGGSFKEEDTVVTEFRPDEGFVLNVTPVKPNYEFIGWSGTGLSKVTPNPITIPAGTTSNRVFKANWVGEKYTVYFIDIEGFSFDSKQIRYGERYGELPDISKEGYDAGWYTVLGKRVTADSIVESTVDENIREIAWQFVQRYLPQDDSIFSRIVRDFVKGVIDTIGTNNSIVLVANRTPYTNTPYQINYLVQKLGFGKDDYANYEMYANSKTGYGKTDSEIDFDKEAIEIKGFTYVHHDGDSKIKANGESTINLYYARNTYEVAFDSKGGSDVESQFVNHEGLAYRPEDPHREGYTFNGWYLDGKAFDFNTRITHGIKLNAGWLYGNPVHIDVVANNASYGTVSGSGDYKPNDQITISASPNSGYRFAGWDDENTDNPRIVTVSEDRKYTAIFEKISSRSLVNYETVVISGKSGEIVNVSNVFKSGLLIRDYSYTPENSPLTFEHSILGEYVNIASGTRPGTYEFDVTAYPRLLLPYDVSIVHFIVKVEGNTFTVTFDSNGGSEVETQIVNEGEKAVRPDDPSREGYVFRGWYSDNGLFNFDTAIESDVDLKAKWSDEAGEMFVITVGENNPAYGEASGGMDYREGSTATISARANSGYKFVGWDDNDDGEIDKTDNPRSFIVEADGTYIAFFEKIDDGSLVNYEARSYVASKGDDIDVEDVFKDLSAKFEEVGKPSGSPLELDVYYNKYISRLNYAYLIVSNNAKPGSYDLKVKVSKGDRVDYVTFTVNIGYTVAFDDGYIFGRYTEVTVLPNQSVNKPEDPSRNRYIFMGWYLNNKLYDFGTPVTDNITLIAKWSTPVTVTFDADNGSTPTTQDVGKGGIAVKPKDPIKAGSRFEGWYLGEELFDFNTPVNDSITLKAKWSQAVVVSFETFGGSYIEPQIINKGEKALRPVDPVKNGYRFVGWYAGEGEYDFNKPVEADISLVAVWDIRDDYRVNFESNGGTPVSARTNVMWTQTGLADGKTPIRLGRVFAGWYVDKDLKVPYVNQSYSELANYDDSVGSVTLYADWYNPGLVDYVTTFTSTEGEEASFEIKNNSRWYLLFSEYEIVGGNESGMFRMDYDNNHVIISDKAEPGTYYIKVSSKINSLIPVERLDNLQTLLIEWTVEPKPVEPISEEEPPVEEPTDDQLPADPLVDPSEDDSQGDKPTGEEVQLPAQTGNDVLPIENDETVVENQDAVDPSNEENKDDTNGDNQVVESPASSNDETVNQ